jgi:hypothetical protein
MNKAVRERIFEHYAWCLFTANFSARRRTRAMLLAMPKSPFVSACCAVAVAACAHQPGPATSPQTGSTNTQAEPAHDAPLHTYLELVRNAALRDGKTEQTSDCLLESTTTGQRFRGEVAVGIRPLPLPSLDLDPALEQNISVSLLTAYGRYGEAPNALAFSAFSYAPPTREAVLLVLTDRGHYVRSTRAGGPMLNRVDGAEAARVAGGIANATVFVAAEADVSLTQVHQLLELLTARYASVALAVNLAPETRLPVPGPVVETLCAEGLSATNAASGDLQSSSITPALAPLLERARDCLSAGDPRGAAGGRLELALRVAASGAVEEACILSDQTGDPGLRACVVNEAKKLVFPAPTPAGSVDLQLPLALTARHAPAPRALCSGTSTP